MARRKKDSGLVGALVTSPWWLSVLLGVAAFGALRWLAPAWLGAHPPLRGIADLAYAKAWLAPAFFGLMALLSLLRSAFLQRRPPAVAPPLPRGSGVRAAPAVQHAPVDAARPRAMPAPVQRPLHWSQDALDALEWKRFELLVAKYYEAVGFRSETLPCGADGGIDVKLFKADNPGPIAVVQCKAWHTRPVGVKEVRELLGVMTHEKVARGIFVTTGAYTSDAVSFGNVNPVQLLDGSAILKKILALPAQQQAELLLFAFDGDYSTPSCPSCGIKLVGRESKRGRFWGCSHYPRCKFTLVTASQ